jgi:hypothetical protein
MDGHHSRDDIGYLPAIAAGTLFVFYLVWAAMHDKANGESDSTLEYGALIISVPVFAFLYRMALLHLRPKARCAWLAGTGLLVLLFNLGSMNAKLHPVRWDPMLASLFLIAVSCACPHVYHLVRDNFTCGLARDPEATREDIQKRLRQ